MTINCQGKLIDFTKPKLMGILNLTPDSFYDGGKYRDEQALLTQTEKMLTDGADFIDLGAYSSRPGADHVPEEEELKRLTPVISIILKHFPEAKLSIDTFRSRVAQESVERGAMMINDISAGNLDGQMMPTVGKLKVPYTMMHMRGNPQNMQQQNHYTDLIQEIGYYFSEKIAAAKQHQIHDIIIDPGFGFAKNTAQNFQLLQELDYFSHFDLPVLAGLSRKSMIYKTLGCSATEALNGTTSLNTIALLKGASLLRVHDVKEAKECIELVNQLNA